VERKHLDPMRLGACDRVFDRNVDDVATSLERFAPARMVDENAASDLRAEREKMDAALAVDATCRQQLNAAPVRQSA